jgi:hypothetical protein
MSANQAQETPYKKRSGAGLGPHGLGNIAIWSLKKIIELDSPLSPKHNLHAAHL